MKLRQTKYLIGIGLIAIGIGIVVAANLPKSFQYYVTVDELLAKEKSLQGRELKVAGIVTAGSFQKEETSLATSFRVENAGKIISVSYVGALPDTFKEGAEVVVTGKMNRPGHVTATHVLAKCASKYEAQMKPGLQTPGR